MLCLLVGVVVALTGCARSRPAAYTTQTTATQPVRPPTPTPEADSL